MRGLLREPLVHFLLAGTLIFVLHAWTRGGAAADADPLRISEDDVRWLAGTWARQWRREPSQEELRGLVAELVREQLLAREARALGLDRDDTIVRRRLAQKLEFLVQDTAIGVDPTEEDLRRFYQAHPERFQNEARISFRHVFFSADRRTDAMADARRALAQLDAVADAPAAAGLGDPLVVPPAFHDESLRAIEHLFGPAFREQLGFLEPGRWDGPVASAHGAHLVLVSRFEPTSTRPFVEVREEALARWREEREREARAEYLAGLLEKYDVVVDERVQERFGPLEPVASAAAGVAPEGDG